MGIFSLIKEYFKNKKIKKELFSFKMFLSKLEESFLHLQLISNPTSKVSTYRENISTKKKYSAFAIKYDELTSKTKIHNERVDEINLIVNSFSFSNSIARFDLIDPKALVELVDITKEIAKFKSYESHHEKFIQEVNELNENKIQIGEQLAIKKECSKIYNHILSQDSYIDKKQALEIKKILEHAENKLKQYAKSYFEIEELRIYNEQIVETHNAIYIDNHINNELFENVGGKALGIDQRKAILTDSISNLVIAGAGSGKTLTICGKAKWLLEDQKVPKKDIVFLSYSKASADDLERKLSKINDNLNVSTFHSLGLKILETKDNKKQNVEANYDAIIERFFSEEMLASQNIDILRKILEFYGKFEFTLDEKKYETKGEHFEKLKEADFQTLKQILVNLSNNQEERETILKEKVKSFEEMVIANFYFLNGIKYRYEKPFPIDTTTPDYRQYNPDFTLIEHDIFHEHFGVDRNGRCTLYSKEEEYFYIQSMMWKEQLHRQYYTKYIKTYSYEFSEQTIFKKLEENLKSFGVELKPISADEVRNALGSVYKNRNFNSFIKLVKTFINLYKSRYSNNAHFEILKSEEFANPYEKQRSVLFLDIAKEIYDYYRSQLDGKTDFDDMILEAIKIIPTTNQFKYKYIIVDEFQDISYSRMDFLRTLIRHGNSKIFAVGDDWQSIYRFAGSDIGIFINFDNYFEMTTECRLINNFRNSEELHQIIEPFITVNLEQKKKSITCSNQLTNPVKIVYYESNKVSALNAALAEIQAKNHKASVLLLGRNNFDIEDYLSKTIQINKDGNIIHDGFQNMNIAFKTVHRSKGLEEDYVIVINNEDSKTGFPNKIEDDPILSLVLSNKSRYAYSEERRLFYVALTRTRSYCYLLVDVNKPSLFINEIEDNCEITNPELLDDSETIACPYCKTGHLVLRGEWGNQFYGCSNYPYCEYNQKKSVIDGSKRCPRCNHFIVWRDGRWSKFLGCSNYPRCKYTINPKDYDFERWKPSFERYKKSS